MAVTYCGACEHPSALHVGARGKCRLNGCPCTEFADPPLTLAPQMQLVRVPVKPSWLSLAGPAAIAFIAGVLLGLNL